MCLICPFFSHFSFQPSAFIFLLSLFEYLSVSFMWLIRRQESIGVISLVFYCLLLLVYPPSPQLGDINNPLPQHTFHARVSTALAALAWHSHPSLCTPSSYITHHPPVSLYFSLPTPPSPCCFSIPCHRLSTWKHLSSSLTASCGRHSEKNKKNRKKPSVAICKNAKR